MNMETSKVGLGGAGRLACAGAALALALRAALRLWFYDFDTGFYTVNGGLVWLSLGLPLLAGAGAVWLCVRGKARLGPLPQGKHPAAGAMAAVSGGVLLWAGAALAADYGQYAQTGLSRFESAGQWVHVAFLLMCLLGGAAQLALAAGLFTGRQLFAHMPLLYLPAVLWGAAYMVLTYVFYAKSSSTVENICTMGGAAAIFLGLLYLCRLLAGAGAPGAGLRASVAGVGAALLALPYHGADLALRLAGRGYAGEMPGELQLCGLAMAAFLLVFAVGYLRAGGQGREDG